MSVDFSPWYHAVDDTVMNKYLTVKSLFIARFLLLIYRHFAAEDYGKGNL